MIRSLRIIFFAFLLLLPLAAAAIWIAHPHLPSCHTSRPTGANYRLLWLPDHIRLARDTFHPPVPAASPAITNPNIHFAFLGIGYHYEFNDFGGLESGGWFYPRGSYSRSVTLPYWFLLLITALPPALWIVRLLRRRPDLDSKLCPKCRYDLRTHNPGDKCPECGTPVPDKGTITSP